MAKKTDKNYESEVAEEEVVMPMASNPPSLEDRVAALERAVQLLDAALSKHTRYHFGKDQ